MSGSAHITRSMTVKNECFHKFSKLFFRYFEKEQFSHSADKLALIGPAVTQYIRLTPGRFWVQF